MRCILGEGRAGSDASAWGGGWIGAGCTGAQRRIHPHRAWAGVRAGRSAASAPRGALVEVLAILALVFGGAAKIWTRVIIT